MIVFFVKKPLCYLINAISAFHALIFIGPIWFMMYGSTITGELKGDMYELSDRYMWMELTNILICVVDSLFHKFNMKLTVDNRFLKSIYYSFWICINVWGTYSLYKANIDRAIDFYVLFLFSMSMINYLVMCVACFNVMAICYYSNNQNNNQNNNNQNINEDGYQSLRDSVSSDEIVSEEFKKDNRFSIRECSICMQEFTENTENTGNNVIAKLKCDHIYHKECIKEWFRTKKTCPTCKQ
jgi:hypothetical protein